MHVIAIPLRFYLHSKALSKILVFCLVVANPKAISTKICFSKLRYIEVRFTLLAVYEIEFYILQLRQLDIRYVHS